MSEPSLREPDNILEVLTVQVRPCGDYIFFYFYFPAPQSAFMLSKPNYLYSAEEATISSSGICLLHLFLKLMNSPGLVLLSILHPCWRAEGNNTKFTTFELGITPVHGQWCQRKGFRYPKNGYGDKCQLSRYCKRERTLYGDNSRLYAKITPLCAGHVIAQYRRRIVVSDPIKSAGVIVTYYVT